MSRSVIAFAGLVLLAGLLSMGVASAGEPATSVSGGGVTLKNVAVTLPSSSRQFPGTGPGADVTNANCVTCHSPSMVLLQPPLTKATWEAEVTKMRKVYGAPVSDADAPVIVDYLASLKPGQ